MMLLLLVVVPLNVFSLDVPRPKAESPLTTPTPASTPIMEYPGELIIKELPHVANPPLIGLHPHTGQYVYMGLTNFHPQNNTKIIFLDSHDWSAWFPYAASYSYSLNTANQFLDWKISPNGPFYMTTQNNGVLSVMPGENEPVQIADVYAPKIWLVSENANIHGASTGDLLIAHRKNGLSGSPDMISVIKPQSESPTLTPLVDSHEFFTFKFADMTEGPSGNLYVLTSMSGVALSRIGVGGNVSDEIDLHQIPNAGDVVYDKWNNYFYITTQSRDPLRLYRIRPYGHGPEQIAEFVDTDSSLSIAPNGDLLIGNKFRLSINEDYTPPPPTPTFTPRPTYTPTLTATPTPLPYQNVNHEYEAELWEAPVVTTESGGALEFWGKVPGRDLYLYVALLHPPGTNPPLYNFYLLNKDDLDQPSVGDPAYSFQLEYYDYLNSDIWMLDSFDRLYLSSRYSNRDFVIEPLPAENMYTIGSKNLLFLPVAESTNIVGCEPGDAVALRDTVTLKNCFYRISISPDSETPIEAPLVEPAITPTPHPYSQNRLGISTFPNLEIVDALEGLDGKLHVLTNYPVKILRLEEDGRIIEVTHHLLDTFASKFVYAPEEKCFYVLVGKRPRRLLRVDDSGRNEIFISELNSNFNHPSLELLNDKTILIDKRIAIRKKQPLSATPTPAPPTPTPRPVADWFVLDGFGGIHSTNPEIPRPALPYIPTFNIMRDIEPDPLGRGWYMLDGWGGIHASSPDMPIPRDLPYFWGYDIARNLEVKNTPDGLMFYLLDGFGVVHTNDPDFHQGYLPWFGEDRFVDLEPEPNGDGWIVLDNSGTLYYSNRIEPDKPLFVNNMIRVHSISSFVRFADETTVLIDLWGGRHTNSYHPAANVLDGLSPDFYFPGWDIAWDIEPIYAE